MRVADAGTDRLRRAQALAAASIAAVVIICGRIVLENIHRHERALSLALALSDQSRKAGQAGGSASALRTLSTRVAEAVTDGRQSDISTEHALAFWLIVLAGLLFFESRLLVRLLIAPIRQSILDERLAAEQERERRVVKARERELRLQNRELERLAGTDPLTGLPNRRALVTWLRRESDRLVPSAIPLGVLMIDIDHFKGLNDQFGHAVGDEALRLVGRTIQHNIRGSDLAARYGGEEFVVLLPGANEVDTAEVAEVVREAIADADWNAGRLRVSVGAVSAVPEFDGDALIRAADRALYDAKRAGRNRTVIGVLPDRPGAASPRN